MLWDPKHDLKWQTKVDPLSLEGLIAWLEQQPSDKEYPYHDIQGACMVGQYMASHGVTWSCRNFVNGWSSLFGRITAVQPWTFDAALERARAELAKGAS